MQACRFLRDTLLACWVLSCAGCSSLGLSCLPRGHALTDQAEELLSPSSRSAQIPDAIDRGVIPAGELQPGDSLRIEPGELQPARRYYVLGEVHSPGSYPLKGHETVLDAVQSAGGLTTAADPCKILLVRPTPSSTCRITRPVCYRQITQLGDPNNNYPIQPGDRIFVASGAWCEDMKRWQTTTTCARCCDCQGSELPDPPSRFDAVIDGPGCFTTGIRAAKASPARLPSPVDGELECGPGESSDRFEPLWITAGSVAELTWAKR